MVLARAMVHDRADLQERARTYSVLMLTASAAPLLAPLVGAALLELGGWRAIFGAMGLIGLALLMLSTAIPETLARSGRARIERAYEPHSWREILRDRVFITWGLSNGLFQGGMFAYLSMSAAVFIDAYGLSAGVFSILFAANSLGMVVAAQVNARLVGRFALRRVVKWALWAALIPLCVLAIFYEKPPAPLLFANVFLYLSMIGFVAPNSAAIALTGHAARAGSASALLGTVLFGVGVVSSVAAAHVLPGAPVRALMLAMLTCCALATAVFYLTPR